VCRCTKDSTQLDLSACKVWTRFLEVHYERLGGDGLPSHKEITVIFFPTLFDCVPSPEVWQTQWIERQQAKLKLEAASKEEKVFPLSPNVLLFPMVCCKCLEREKTVVPQLTISIVCCELFLNQVSWFLNLMHAFAHHQGGLESLHLKPPCSVYWQ
jgi:hypothetical protein